MSNDAPHRAALRPARHRCQSLLVALLTFVAAVGCVERVPSEVEPVPEPASPNPQRCEVIVAGGSLAATAAAIHAAREGARTCLLEPTDVVGGQISNEGVSAPDFAGHSVDGLDVARMSRNPANVSPSFQQLIRDLGNPGRCWVSPNCFRTEDAAARLDAMLAAEKNLQVFRRTLVVQVVTGPSTREGMSEIREVIGVQRSGADDRLYWLSDVIREWYDPFPSPRYPTKTVHRFSNGTGPRPVVIEASAFGDVLVLSGARWLQGADATDGGTGTRADSCGLAIVFPFLLKWGVSPVPESEWESLGGSTVRADDPRFNLLSFGWSKVWTYRRLSSVASTPGPGDESMQNWNPGNDYRAGYYLKSFAGAQGERTGGWRGGVRLSVLRAAEQHALDYAAWYRSQAPGEAKPYLSLSRTWGTANGLARMPYLRDTRRAIGLDNFVLRGQDFIGPGAQVTGTVFPDRVAIGAYQFDNRPLQGCATPPYTSVINALPYYIPFRALTSGDVANLLVAGKSMAQSTLANTATRLHPVEWHSGVAAGVAAAWMFTTRGDSRDALDHVAQVQQRIARWAPIDWTR